MDDQMSGLVESLHAKAWEKRKQRLHEQGIEHGRAFGLTATDADIFRQFECIKWEGLYGPSRNFSKRTFEHLPVAWDKLPFATADLREHDAYLLGFIDGTLAVWDAG